MRRAYELYTGGKDRFSWDQTAALCAVRGAELYWDRVTSGHCEVQPDGDSRWQAGGDGRHSYLVPKMAPGEVARVIEDLMVRAPG